MERDDRTGRGGHCLGGNALLRRSEQMGRAVAQAITPTCSGTMKSASVQARMSSTV